MNVQHKTTDRPVPITADDLTVDDESRLIGREEWERARGKWESWDDWNARQREIEATKKPKARKKGR